MTTNPPSLPVPQMSDLTESEYRARPGLSGTQVKTLLDSPARYRWERENPRPRKAATTLGTIFHALVLGQPLDVNVDDREFRSKADKEWRETQHAAGLTIVKSDVMRAAEQMTAAVTTHQAAFDLLRESGKSEAVVTGEHRGYPLKGRIDRLTSRVIDLKSARDASPRSVSGAMDEYGYALQLAHYSALAGVDAAPVLIVCENVAPYLVAVYELDSLTWELAKRATALAWDVYADCEDRDEWPSGLPEGITELGLRPWAYDQLDERVNPDFYTEMEIG